MVRATGPGEFEDSPQSVGYGADRYAGYPTREEAQPMTELEVALEEARRQGQREGRAAVCQWLRDRGATKPPSSLWHAAAILANDFEQSETPCAAIRKEATIEGSKQ